MAANMLRPLLHPVQKKMLPGLRAGAIVKAPALSYEWHAPGRGAAPSYRVGHIMDFASFAGVYLLAVNLLAAGAFVHDKRAAISGGWRVSEDRLLAIAFLGGSIGAKLSQMLLRHKIRKEPFRQQLNGILAVQVVAMAAIWAIHHVQGGFMGLAIGW